MNKNRTGLATRAKAGLVGGLIVAGLMGASFVMAAESQSGTDLTKLSGAVKIDGSSTVYPITEAVAEEFSKAVNKKVRVTVAVSGTGGGFKRFAAGETDVSNASRPIKQDEMDIAAKNGVEFIELPIAYDGLSIVVNPKNTWAKEITVEELKRIFLDGSSVKTWRDLRPEYPATPMRIFAPGTDSGTFDYFKEIVAGKDGAIRSDMNVSEDDNVLVTGVAGDAGAIGFFGCAYYFENKSRLRALPVDGGKGAIEPTHDTIEDGTYAPFSRPLFIYVSKKSAERPEVKAFAEFYLKQGAELAEEVGYVKLPKDIYGKALANLAAGRTGSQFTTADGKSVHGPLSDIFK